MSQTGYSKVQLYSSSTATNTPSASNLTNDTNGSELAINITDGKLFYKDNGGTVQVIASKASNSGSFTTLSGSTSTTTPIVQSSGSLLLNTNGTTTAVTIDTAQNLGLGVTPNTWYTSYKALQINSASFVGVSDRAISAQNWYVNASGSDTYINTAPATLFRQYNGTHTWNVAPSGTAGTSISFTQAMTLDNSGNLVIGGTTAASARFNILTTGGSSSQYINFDGDIIAYAASNGGASATQTVLLVQKVSNGRSINAAGTVNVSGSDYAEYMEKSGNFTINKGDICGIDVNGKLTNVFANAISFVVKSTNPSYVGGDVWGSPESLGLTKPTSPVRSENESDADWATAEANYQTALTVYEAQLATATENARQIVDRIAFCGQVPVNVTGATSGQYIVPVAKQDGSIGGEAVSESAITLQQYMQSVGKVISVENNVTTIIVKVA